MNEYCKCLYVVDFEIGGILIHYTNEKIDSNKLSDLPMERTKKKILYCIIFLMGSGILYTCNHPRDIEKGHLYQMSIHLDASSNSETVTSSPAY